MWIYKKIGPTIMIYGVLVPLPPRPLVFTATGGLSIYNYEYIGPIIKSCGQNYVGPYSFWRNPQIVATIDFIVVGVKPNPIATKIALENWIPSITEVELYNILSQLP